MWRRSHAPSTLLAVLVLCSCVIVQHAQSSVVAQQTLTSSTTPTRSASPSTSTSPTASKSRTGLSTNTVSSSVSFLSRTRSPSLSPRHHSQSEVDTASPSAPLTASRTSTVTVNSPIQSASVSETLSLTSSGELSVSASRPSRSRSRESATPISTVTGTSSVSRTVTRWTRTSEQTRSSTQTSSATNLISSSATMSISSDVTSTNTVAASPSFVIVPTATVSFSATLSFSSERTTSDSAARSQSSTNTLSDEKRSASSSADPTVTRTDSPSAEPTASQSSTFSPSRAPTETRTPSHSPSVTSSPSPDRSVSATLTVSLSYTSSPSRTVTISSEITSTDTVVPSPSPTFVAWSGSPTYSSTNLVTSSRTLTATDDNSLSASATRSLSFESTRSSSGSRSVSTTRSVTIDHTETKTFSDTLTLLPPFPIVPLTYSRFSVTWKGSMWVGLLASNATATLISASIKADVARLLFLPQERITVTSLRSGSLIAEVTVVRNNSQVIPDFMIQRYLAEGNYSMLLDFYVNVTRDSSFDIGTFVGAVFPIQLAREIDSPTSCSTLCVIVVTSAICGVAVLVASAFCVWRCLLRKPMLQKIFQGRHMHIEVNSPAGLMPSAVVRRKTGSLEARAELEHKRAATFREPIDPDGDGEEEIKVRRTRGGPVGAGGKFLPAGFALLARKTSPSLQTTTLTDDPLHDDDDSDGSDESSPTPYKSHFRLSNVVEVCSVRNSEKDSGEGNEHPVSATESCPPLAEPEHPRRHCVVFVSSSFAQGERRAAFDGQLHEEEEDVEGAFEVMGHASQRADMPDAREGVLSEEDNDGAANDDSSSRSEPVLMSGRVTTVAARSIVLQRAPHSFIPPRVVDPDTFSHYIAANSEHEQHDRNPLNTDEVIVEEAFAQALEPLQVPLPDI